MVTPQSTRLTGTTIDLPALCRLRSVSQALYLTNSSTRQKLSGDRQSVLRGRGMMYSESRCYQPGDDVRHMDWRVTARQQKPHIKLFEEERERPVYLVIDFAPSLFFGTQIAFKSVLAAEVASLLAWASVSVGDRIGAVIQSSTKDVVIKPRARHGGAIAVLKAIVDSHKSLSTAENTNFADMLNKTRRLAKPGSLIIIISDFLHCEAEAESHLVQLAHHQDVLSIAISDPLEADLPNAGRLAFTDGQEILGVNTQNSTLRKSFSEDFHAHRDALQSLHHRYGMRWLSLTTQMDVLRELAQALNQTRRRR